MSALVLTWKQAEAYAYEAVLANHETWLARDRILGGVETEMRDAFVLYMTRLLPAVSNPEADESRIALSAKLVCARERFVRGVAAYAFSIIEANLSKFRDDPSTVDYIMERVPLPLLEALIEQMDSAVVGACLCEWLARTSGSTH